MSRKNTDSPAADESDEELSPTDETKSLKEQACRLYGFTLQELEEIKEQAVKLPSGVFNPHMTGDVPAAAYDFNTQCDYPSAQNITICNVSKTHEEWRTALCNLDRITDANNVAFEAGCKELYAKQQCVYKKRDQMTEVEGQMEDKVVQQTAEVAANKKARVAARSHTEGERIAANNDFSKRAENMQKTVDNIEKAENEIARLNAELALQQNLLDTEAHSLKGQLEDFKITQTKCQSKLAANIAAEDAADNKIKTSIEKLEDTLYGKETITKCRAAADDYLSNEIDPKVQQAKNDLTTTRSAMHKTAYGRHSDYFYKLGSLGSDALEYRVHAFFCCPIFSDYTEEVTLTPTGSDEGKQYVFRYKSTRTFEITDEKGNLLSGSKYWKIAAVEDGGDLFTLTSDKKTLYSVNDETKFTITGSLPVAPLAMRVNITAPNSGEKNEFGATHVGESEFEFLSGLDKVKFRGRDRWVVKPVPSDTSDRCHTFTFTNPEDDSVLVENGSSHFTVTAVPKE
eukprot:TRINITY_DN1363_c12_g1_i1.p1 TRINITY_DN1363_c12_g1~~TRINITY_DN1363_c12_g1_i1.p1  ORF type:complete len:513 (+),score=86.56 TRINITY_DN1363_c12_g1_i1:73-1611(+)